MEKLTSLYLHGNPLSDVPRQALGERSGSNCLEAVRAHFKDREYKPVLDRKMKLVLLGNGGVGKTSIKKRMLHDDFDPKEKTTHAISLEQWDLDVDEETAEVNVWDFGGQDIYHGTHSLFLKTEAIFLVVWDAKTEATREPYRQDDLFFVHYPRQYWLDYVQHASPRSPTLVIENKCDDRNPSPPTGDLHGGQPLSFSAQESFNCDALLGLIKDLCRQELAKTGQRMIGLGRRNVSNKLQAYLKEGRKTVSKQHFIELCEAEDGKVSSAEELLKFLHHGGSLFYQPGLFHDKIILDQEWAIDAVYALFHREKCVRRLQRNRGRFRRTDLEDWIWGDTYSEDEQKLLISFMVSCDICFPVESGEEEQEYLAPSMLPPLDDRHIKRDRDNWRSGHTASFWLRHHHEHMHAGFMAQILSKLGMRHGDDAIYWRDGVMLGDAGAFAELTCDQSRQEITLEVWGENWKRLLAQLRQEIATDKVRTFASVNGQSWVDVDDLDKYLKLGKALDTDGNVQEVEPYRFLLHHEERMPETRPVQKNSGRPAIYFSYAWKGRDFNHEEIVDEIYALLKKEGNELRRDKVDMSYKSSISEFMNDIARGQCIIVVLSDKYFRSPYCMGELVLIKEQSQHSASDLLRRIQPIRIEDTAEPKVYADYWAQMLEEKEDEQRQLAEQRQSYTELSKEIDLIRRISTDCHNLVSFFKDPIVYTPEQLRQDGFELFRKVIDDCLGGV